MSKGDVITRADTDIPVLRLDGADLAGSYDMSLAVTGSCQIVGSFVCLGALYVEGDLVNAGGYPFNVHGECRVGGAFKFTPSDTSTVQADATVGALYFGAASEFKANPGQSPKLIVNGPMTATSPSPTVGITTFDGSGQGDSANALTMNITGEATGIAFVAAGSASAGAAPGGSGGVIFVGGDFYGTFACDGGSGSADQDAGAGGGIITNGNIILWDSSHAVGGGTDGTGRGGHGGTIVAFAIDGFDGATLSIAGGNSTSGAGGDGGSAAIYSMIEGGTIHLDGGNGGTNGGNGGILQWPLAVCDGGVSQNGGNGGTLGGIPGQRLTITGNSSLYTFSALSGTGGSPSSNGSLILTGGVVIGALTADPDPAFKICGNVAANLQIGTLTGPTFLYSFSGSTHSADISSLVGSSIFVYSSGAGSVWTALSGAVVVDTANLSGSYNQSLIASGSCNVVGSTTVMGALYVGGDLVNAGGYEFNVRGECRVEGAFNFTPSDTATPQSDATVGALYYGSPSQFRVNPGQSPSLQVNGELVATSATLDSTVLLDGTGQGDSSQGLGIFVLGDTYGTYLDVAGAASAGGSAGAVGGNGGSIFVGGDFSGQFNARGGDGADGFAAGAGGSFQSNGAAYLSDDSYLSGGSTAGSGAAGPAGSFEARTLSNVDGGVLEALGGNSAGDAGGNGGTVTVWTTVTQCPLILDGGSGATTGGNGGSVTTTTTFVASDVSQNGGNGGTLGGLPGGLSVCGNSSIPAYMAIAGTGGTPAVTATVGLSGAAYIGTFTADPACKIFPQGDTAYAQFGSFTGPTTLYLPDMTTPSGSMATLVGSSAFIYNATGSAWYALIGSPF